MVDTVRRLALVGLVLMVAAGCGPGSGNETSTGTSAAPDDAGGVDFVGIEAVVGSDDRSVTVRTEPLPVEAADGECEATVTPRIQGGEQGGAALVTIDVAADRPRLTSDGPRDANGFPIVWEGCATETRVLTVEVGYPVQAVTDPMGSQFWIEDGQWVGCDHIVMTCIVDPASCDNSTLRDTIANSDVPRHFGMANDRCEAPFAVVDVDYGAGDCPVTGEPGDNPCAGQRLQRMYFRIEDGAWVWVGTNDGPGCGDIAATTPEFPQHLCEDLPGLGQ